MKLVDITDLKSVGSNAVWVQIPFLPLYKRFCYATDSDNGCKRNDSRDTKQ